VAVTQLCDGTMCNGPSELWTGVHCVVGPCRPLYGGGGPCMSLNCVMAQCTMVHLKHEKGAIVWLSHGGHVMVG
jgi:hypothetical protein